MGTAGAHSLILNVPGSGLPRFSTACPSEVVFTSGGTEGDNLAFKGMMSPGDHIIVSAIEHSAILSTCTWLEHLGCEVTRVGVNSNGQVDPDSVRRALRKNTRLISIMMANNETGVLQPVEEIGKIAAKRMYGSIRMRCRRRAKFRFR